MHSMHAVHASGKMQLLEVRNVSMTHATHLSDLLGVMPGLTDMLAELVLTVCAMHVWGVLHRVLSPWIALNIAG